MPRFSECWRCGKVSVTIVCPSCNVAKYCSTKCQENDSARHTDAECRPASIIKECSSCHNTGSALRTCTGCYRVFYCDAKCQKDHRDEHKVECKCIVEKIKSLAGRLMTHFPPKTAKLCVGHYYWGNLPAYDYLNLSENEGVDYNADMNVLVLGVGDLRNIVITCASLPKNFTSKVLFTLNDSDRCVLARLVLLLYMMIKCDSSIEKVVTEIWYSTLLSETTYNYLCASLQGLLGLKNAEHFMSSTGQLVSLSNFHLKELQKVWKQWLNMKVEGTTRILGQRKKQMDENPENSFGIISYYECIPREHVPSAKKYMKDGVFRRTPKSSFAENPTLTGPPLPENDGLFTYCCISNILPFAGWDYVEVKKLEHSNSLVRMFGNYIENKLRCFMNKLASKQVSFKIVLGDCMKLDESIFNQVKYDRIMTSNLMDYIFLPDLLSVYSGKLNKDNPYATLITETVNWILFCPAADADFTSISQAFYFKNIVVQDGNNPALANNGRISYREYWDNFHELQDYLRALFYVYQERKKEGTSNSTKLPSLKDLGIEFQLRLRDCMRNENRIVFFRQAVNRRRVTMTSGFERFLEWVVK